MSTLLERLKARGPLAPEERARIEDSVMASIDAQREASNARFDKNFLITFASLKLPVVGSPVRPNATAPM
jgi:hypothetical protein